MYSFFLKLKIIKTLIIVFLQGGDLLYGFNSSTIIDNKRGVEISESYFLEEIKTKSKVFPKSFKSRKQLVAFFKSKIKTENSNLFNTIVTTENYYDNYLGGGASYMLVKQEDYVKLRGVNTANPYAKLNGGICLGKNCAERKESFIDIPITSVNGKFVNAILLNQGVLRSSQIGCKADGKTDNAEMINAAMNYAYFKGGDSKIILEPGKKPLAISSSIYIKSHQILKAETWLKVIGSDLGPKDAAIVIENAHDIQIKGLKVDCNNVPAQGGINVHFNSGNILIDNVIIKNARHLKKSESSCKGCYGGGRAINIEYGNYNLKRDVQNERFISDKKVKYQNCIINNIIIENSYMGLSLAGGIKANFNNEDKTDDRILGVSNCIINNVVMSKTEVMVGLFGNIGKGYFSGDRMQYIVSNISARNCGKRWNIESDRFESTYGNGRNSGLISSDRGSNVNISNVSVVNDEKIGEIYSPIVGDFYNVQIDNFNFDGKSERIACFQRFTEKDIIHEKEDVFETRSSDFKINYIGRCSGKIFSFSNLNKVKSTFFEMSEFDPDEYKNRMDCLEQKKDCDLSKIVSDYYSIRDNIFDKKEGAIFENFHYKICNKVYDTIVGNYIR